MDKESIHALERIYKGGEDFLKKLKNDNNNRYVFVPALEGANYESSKTKVMVIGRAPGEYSMHNYDGNLSEWFEKMEHLRWVYEKCNVYADGSEHMPSQNRSAFWQLIKKVLISENVLIGNNAHDFADSIVWSNLYKIKNGINNKAPSDKLCNSQKKLMDEILSKEIEIYSPDIILFITKRKSLNSETQCSWFDLRDFQLTYETILHSNVKTAKLYYRPEFGYLQESFKNPIIIDTTYRNLKQTARKT